MLRRKLLVKLNEESIEGRAYVRIQQAARTALMGAYGVQNVRIERAADSSTSEQWDLCITIDYVSDVDEGRSARDPIRIAFEERFLAARAIRIWSGVFVSD